MRRLTDFRNDFSAGVIGKEFLGRAQRELTEKALKTGDNAFVTNAGTVMRRCGSNRIARGLGAGRAAVMDMIDGTIRHLIFRNGFVDILASDGTLEATVAGPWATADLYTMTIVNGESSVTVWSPSFHPQIINKPSSSWVVANYAFRVDSLNRKAAPFYRFGAPGVTMTLSAYSGTGVTMNFSSATLAAGHVGYRFMYAQCQVLVTGYTSATEGTVTIIDQIYPTVRVGVGSPSSFKVGDLCEGDITNVRGQIVAVNSGGGTVDVVLTEGYTLFQAEVGSTPGEKLISTEASDTITTVTSLGTPSGTNIWFEELISPVRGYPRTAAIHKRRLVISGFPEQPSLVAASARGAMDDFNLGSGSDNDAILEPIGEDPDAEVKHLTSSEQLIVSTDRGVWYVPEGNGRSFTPAGVGFDKISPDAVGDVEPVLTPEGIIILDNEGRAIVLALTGTQRGAWAGTEISAIGQHLINSPKQMVYSSGVGGRSERVVVIVNGDGTAAVFVYRRGADQAGWLPWSRGAGDSYQSFSSFNGALFCYALAGGFYSLEEFDFDAVIDAEFDPAVTTYINEDLHVLDASHVVGEASTDGAGAHDYVYDLDRLGRDFSVKIEPAPLVISQAGRMIRRIARSLVDVINTGLFYVNSEEKSGYQYGDDLEVPPPLRDREEKAGQTGSATDRTIAIEQFEGSGAPLHVRSITMKVAAR